MTKRIEVNRDNNLQHNNNVILISATKFTPEVVYNKELSTLEIHGQLNPENPDSFFKNAHKLVDHFRLSNSTSLSINIKLEFLSISSAGYFFEFMKYISGLKSLGKQIDINWYYDVEDQQMLEVAEDFASTLNQDINYMPYIQDGTFFERFISI